jgi:hypothetical protein
MDMKARRAAALLLMGLVLSCGTKAGDPEQPVAPAPTTTTPTKPDPLRDSTPSTGQGIDERVPPK